MILAISRFRVANGMEGQIKQAFFDRPHLVDSQPAFLGMETFNDAGDSTIFYLVTRWTDNDSFQKWHRSADHKKSHRFMPKGLKLDPAFTKLTILDRLDAPGRPLEFDEVVADAAPILSTFISESRDLHFIVADLNGTVMTCNPAVVTNLKVEIEKVLGHNLGQFLTEQGSTLLQREIENAKRGTGGDFVLNFIDAQSHPYTVQCSIHLRPDHFVLIGAPPVAEEQALRDELLAINNQLAVLARENAQKSKTLVKANADLEQAFDDLRASHWQLRKIQELLPICMICQKVKTGDGQWGELIDFFKANSDFLSHGYCPDCGAKAIAEFTKTERTIAE